MQMFFACLLRTERGRSSDQRGLAQLQGGWGFGGAGQKGKWVWAGSSWPVVRGGRWREEELLRHGSLWTGKGTEQERGRGG